MSVRILGKCHDPTFEASKDRIVTKKTKSKTNKNKNKNKIEDKTPTKFKTRKGNQGHQN